MTEINQTLVEDDAAIEADAAMTVQMPEINQALVAGDIVIGLAVSNALGEGWIQVDEAIAAQVEALGVGRARLVDGGVVAYEPPVPPIDLLAHAATRRWQIETGGIVIAGIPVATDDRSQLKILGARVAAVANSGWSTVWSGADGGSYPLNAAAMIAISDAVEAHVNAIFARFALIKGEIDAGTITTTGEVDAAFAA